MDAARLRAHAALVSATPVSMATIYRKTRIGQAEIETRALRLLPRLRNLLIIIDGKRDAAALQGMLGYEPAAALNELLAYGLIEPSQQRMVPTVDAVAVAAANAAPSTQPPALDAAAFSQLRKEAVRALNDALGPAAETTAMRMEKAQTEAELQPLLERAAGMVAAVRGGAAGRAYAQRFVAKG